MIPSVPAENLWGFFSVSGASLPRVSVSLCRVQSLALLGSAQGCRRVTVTLGYSAHVDNGFSPFASAVSPQAPLYVICAPAGRPACPDRAAQGQGAGMSLAGERADKQARLMGVLVG